MESFKDQQDTTFNHLHKPQNKMELISIILNFVLSSGLLATLIFYKIKRRAEIAEVVAKETGNRRNSISIEHQSIEFLKSQLSDAYNEIDKMQEIINNNREQILLLIRQTQELEINLIATQSAFRKNEETHN